MKQKVKSPALTALRVGYMVDETPFGAAIAGYLRWGWLRPANSASCSSGGPVSLDVYQQNKALITCFRAALYDCDIAQLRWSRWVESRRQVK